MSYSRENFIKALFASGNQRDYVSNKKLAERLQISPAAVSDMINKLVTSEQVEHIPYKGCRLTEKGRRDALTILRYHRLWEVFLVNYLGYSPLGAHHEAEQLEHATSLELAEKLNTFLNYPRSCPEGSHIPSDEEIDSSQRLCPLIEMKPGQRGRIHHIINRMDLMAYLEQIGITLNMSIEFVDTLSYGCGVQLLTENGKVQISDKAAVLILVHLDI